MKIRSSAREIKRLCQNEILPKMGNPSQNTRFVFFTGAGISAESGISTFRDQGGLWERYAIEEVATPEAFAKNPKLVLNFYNARRQQLAKVRPNPAHLAMAQFAEKARVQIITQNVDDLHERAGSKEVLHLHGQLQYAQSSGDPAYTLHLEGKDIGIADRCPKGFPLRPFVVWFGESVPLMPVAEQRVGEADLLLVIGSSLQVYPAAGLLHQVRPGVPIVVIDPQEPELTPFNEVYHIQARASEALPMLLDEMEKRLDRPTAG